MKKNKTSIKKTPWDTKIFGINTYEIQTISRNTFEKALKLKGHFTVKVDPSSSKKFLHKYGFYYCDTLIEPHCTPKDFIYFEHENISVSQQIGLDKLVKIATGAFCGRFHRDFNIDNKLADLRYNTWLEQLYKAGSMFTLIFENKPVGFFGFSKHRIQLHAIAKEYRGKGLAKYFWSAACKKLFNAGHKELVSSISSFNLPILNLYSSLGFKFKNSVDVYHSLIT